MVWLSNIFRIGSNYFPGIISDSGAGVLSNCLFLRKYMFMFFSFLCGRGGGGIDYWPFSPLWNCACFVGKALITIVGCLETLCWVYNKPLYKVTMTTTIEKWQGHLLQKIMGERNILLSVKHLVMVLKRTVPMRRFPSSYVLVDKKDFFYHIHFHSCRPSRCLWKDS